MVSLYGISTAHGTGSEYRRSSVPVILNSLDSLDAALTLRDMKDMLEGVYTNQVAPGVPLPELLKSIGTLRRFQHTL